MNRISLLVLVFTQILFGSIHIGYSQNPISVHTGSDVTFFKNIDSALTYAEDGSTLYLPGGIVTNKDIVIDKSVRIIGVGYHPDSTSVTGPTIFNGSLFLVEGADSCLIMGIQGGETEFGGGYGIFFSDKLQRNTSVVKGVVISRVYNLSVFLDPIGGGNSFPSGILIRESINRGLFFGKSQNITISNCFIDGPVREAGPSNLLSNNIILSVSSSSGASYSNNIIYSVGSEVTNSVFENNIFLINKNEIQDPSNQFLNNYFDQLEGDVFMNILESGGYSFLNDYRVKPSSVGYENGKDGTDIGVYGGFFPFKDGGLPFNPHISFKKVSSVSDADGNILINFIINAQKN